MKTKQFSKCKKDKVLTDYDNDRRQCNECIDKRHEYYHNNKDKHKEWDRKQYETHQEDKKAYRAIQIECPICKVMIKKYNKTDNEKTKRHIDNLNNPNNLKQTKQQREQQQAEEKKKEQIRHQLTIEYFNDNFPYFPSE